MGEKREDLCFIANTEYLQPLVEGGLMPSRLFRHRELLQSVPHAPVIKQKELIQTLHYLHFSNAPVLVLLTDPKHEEDFLIQSHLESCAAGEIRCRWPQEAIPVPTNITPLNLIVDDGLSLVLLPIRVIDRCEEGFSAAIPEEGRLLGKRRVGRHVCRGIDIILTQNGFVARGKLIDFSPLAFLVRVTPDKNSFLIWMNPDSPCTVQLRGEGGSLFSGPCRCLRQTGNASEKELVLTPERQEIHRFRRQKKRNPRVKLTPPPTIRFEHPFFRKPVQRDVCDMTVAGLAVDDDYSDGVLLPGMIIPDMEIRHAGVMTMTCTAQVIYRRELGKGRVRFGLAILDMDIRTYKRLGHILAHAEDPHASISTEPEMEALWELFFATGFIYPKKYRLIQHAREEFKETYRRLYREDQEIAVHCTCEGNGRIYAHVSMVRAYQRAWMVHHLSARPLKGRRTGLTVIRYILRFFEGLYRYPSIRMGYMIFYFRPDNYFPNLLFGGFARDFNNPRGCSLDLFACMNHSKGEPRGPLPEGWRLSPFDAGHLAALEQSYRNASGGLLLDVLDLAGKSAGTDEPLSKIYERQGFLRRWDAYALTRGNSLKAALIVDRSDFGINLSELLNSVKVIATDPDTLPPEILNAALAELTAAYPSETVPVMIHPADYPIRMGMKADKKYLLWILDMRYGKEYLEYMNHMTRMTPRFLFRHLLRKLTRK